MGQAEPGVLERGVLYSVGSFFEKKERIVCFFWSQFMQDAQEIMEVLVKAQANQGEMEPDDPQVCTVFVMGLLKIYWFMIGYVVNLQWVTEKFFTGCTLIKYTPR